MDHNDAQVMADFLSIILIQEKEILFTDEGNRILVMLRKLATSARVFPQHFVLKDATYDPMFVAMGSFATVHKGRYRERSVCVKILFDQVDKKECIQELILWAHLSHPNILPFYGIVLDDDSRICMISPWMNNGTLCTYSSKLPQPSRIPLISDVIDGLLYLHNLNIVHSDLKGANVLISDQGRALITDFGISHISTATSRQEYTTSLIGASRRWAPPEAFDQDSEVPIRPTKAQDVWSFGCLCYEVLSRKQPFHQYRQDFRVVSALIRKEIPLRPEPGRHDWDEIGDGMWTLIEDCWSFIPEDRLTLQDIHDRFSGLNTQDDRPKIQVELDFDKIENVLLNVISRSDQNTT
ncbi:kinase-like protein [Macrolepiota fuliginosa MF-IS2]|uniref:Kinase-like protein n=1 Tax=Macrolepiota fuliginosa MF-IS2 TaxID=1400762 RepID=A0A9P5X226_9AGAR|nr:kinase-like protein [Macrolepiota fuliginosa MF-IS2]